TIRGASITNTTVAQAQISDVTAAFEAVQAERAEWERNPLAVTSLICACATVVLVILAPRMVTSPLPLMMPSTVLSAVVTSRLK
ncbi:hypothetical protein, partial [Achromobacter xylosoxidans]|uniref:hypothetical protein n=1 Tax=Alcaligenes xylosoxydans xylosoxydans TaxID=85698 RepID=UPI001F0E0930